MRLLLKQARPEGRRIGYLLPNMRIFPGFVLYPDRPTEVPDEHAVKMLKQNPHLVADADAVAAEVEKPIAKTAEEKRKQKLLDELRSIDFNDLTVAEMNAHFKVLDIPVPTMAVSKKNRAKMLEKACDTVWDQIQ